MVEMNAWLAGKIQHVLSTKAGKVGMLKPLGKI
jgi:hypothetical protein